MSKNMTWLKQKYIDVKMSIRMWTDFKPKLKKNCI